MKSIEEAAKKYKDAAGNIGIALDKDFMDVIRGLDAEQFKLWSDTLFKVGKDSKQIYALTETFALINEGYRIATISGFIQDVKDANKAIEDQVIAYDILSKAKNEDGKLTYNSIEIQKILQDATLTAKIAAQKGLKATKEEQAELNKEIKILTMLLLHEVLKLFTYILI